MKTLLEHKPVGIFGRLAVHLKSLFIIGAFFYTPAYIYYASKLKNKARTIAYSILAIILAAPVTRSRWIQQNWLFEQLARYFQIKVVSTSPIIPSQQTVYAMAPHGIIPFSLGVTAFGRLNTLLNDLKIVTASATRLVPFFSHTLRLGGSIDASATVVDQYLKNGESLGITPGGIAEMYVGYPQPSYLPNHEYAVLNSRKGFVRLAMKHGASIRPCYVFGASKLYKRIVMPQWIEWISNKLRFSLILFYGKYGLPIPFENSLVYALSNSIDTLPYITGGGYTINNNSIN